ncbi:unnamed protein product [Adineta ricciae]|uniref:RBR-type E3 ubiquitin transferase n=1 Tax=Adineta ricciae TaxID=249248 RepID=A0A814GQN0_ADIRI|nr:unnamed protein product [Adineta ricciae]CAF0999448.1 unnamed protein product [Adineta ricciae]
MAISISREMNHHQDIKQRQHCSLFNLDLLNDDHQQIDLTEDTIDNLIRHEHCCSISTPNVENALEKKHANHSCSFAVLQKNYTTQLEHVAQKLLAKEDISSNDCCYCHLLHETNDTKGQFLNGKILLDSTAILDNFLRNNLKKSLLTSPMNSPTTTTSSTAITTNTNSSFKISFASSNQRRWHSERTNRHPNVRANLPLTIAQRQVLEHYANHPLVKAPVSTSSTHRRLHRHELITGKVTENTGTALSALTEQSLNTTTVNLHSRPLSPRSSTSAVLHHTRHYFVQETSTHDQSTKDDDNESISSELSQSSNDDETTELDEISILPNLSTVHLTSSETLMECVICCELKRLQKRTCCEFHACSTCLNTYVEQQIKQGIIRIQCPNQQCHTYMHLDEINKRCLSAELRQKFARLLIDSNRSINIKTCPRCSKIHEIDLGLCRSTRQAPTKVQCVECNLIWCFQCHSPWHDGIQCKEFRRGDRMLKKWAREVHYGQHNAQQCPSCKVYIQRTKGCDHIICARCKTEFCYKCGERFRDIKFIGDHYSELSVLGCKYRFYPDNPLKRRLIRGSILGGKILAAPALLCIAVVAGAVCAGIGLPAYCCLTLVRQIKTRRRRRHHAKLKEPALMTYKTFNDIVPQLIPREPINSIGMKPGLSSIRSNIQDNLEIEIDPTSDAPIAVFDECDINTKTNQKEQKYIYNEMIFLKSLTKTILFRYASTSSTIFALATGQQLRSGVAIIRVSGANATQSLLTLTKEANLEKFQPTKLYLRNLYHHKSNDLIDQCMAVWFKGPKSFTGENVVEFHIHGSKAVASAMFSILGSFPNYRLAEPGEFSKRAYFNGCLDLTEAEGLIDLINAQTEQQRKQSLYQMQGSLKDLYERWRIDLVKSLAHAEAYIDFHEDQHIEADILSEVIGKVKSTHENIHRHLQDHRRGEILRDGCRIAILGAPNAGKSSLLNILTQKPTAIVSPIAGTTRDIIESTLDIGGYPVILSDTAGLRLTNDPVEHEGVTRAFDRAHSCDLLIVVIDVSALSSNENLSDQIDQHVSNLFAMKSSSLDSVTKLVLLNKIDLVNEKLQIKSNKNIIPISCTSGRNIDEFLIKLTEKIAEKCSEPSFSTPFLTNERHRIYLTQTIEDLSMFLALINNNHDLVLAVEHLRLAIRSLGTITGVVYTEELLDVIFRDFCIGK